MKLTVAHCQFSLSVSGVYFGEGIFTLYTPPHEKNNLHRNFGQKAQSASIHVAPTGIKK